MKFARSIILEWKILDEVEPWENQGRSPDHAAGCSPSGPHIRSILVLVGLLTILATGTVFYVWRGAESGAQLLENELRATIATEQGLPLHSDADRAAGDVLAPAATVQVQGLTFHSHVASVQVETTYVEPNGRTHITRQRRFYQPTATGWVRVSPNHAFLGSRQIRETEFFTFVYYPIDSAAVETVAAELDVIYADLGKDYRLPPPLEHVVVELVVDPPPYLSSCYRRHRLCIESPAVASLPADVAEAEVLQLWILSALVYRVRWNAMEIAPFRYGWQYAAYTLPRMQMRRHSELLSAWHNDLAHWLYGIELRTPRPNAQLLAQELSGLCDTHQIVARQRLIAEVASTHLCIEPPMLDLQYLAKYNQHQPPDRIGQLTMPDAELEITETSWMQVLAFETLLDYVVATYGGDALPVLLEGLRRYDTWDALIPAAFDVSAEEFETGWQAYLADDYRQGTP